MFEAVNELMQTTKASLSISGLTFATAYAAFIDIIPPSTAIASLVLVIYTLILKRRNNKRAALKAQSEELRAQELHNLKIKLAEKELNE